MQPEYTSQLEEIVKALNHQSTPTWLIAIASGFLGFLASILGQIFQRWYGEYRDRSRMRKIIYSELGAIYSMLVYLQPDMVSGRDKEDHKYEQDKFRNHFLRHEGEGHATKFDGEKYAEDHKDVFIQLGERRRIVDLYSVARGAFIDDEDYGFVLNSRLAIEIIEDYVRFDWLPKKMVERYMKPIPAFRRWRLKTWRT